MKSRLEKLQLCCDVTVECWTVIKAAYVLLNDLTHQYIIPSILSHLVKCLLFHALMIFMFYLSSTVVNFHSRTVSFYSRPVNLQ